MSQAKVDRYKEEKKNRQKNLKKQKAKKTVGIIITAAIIGAIIGVPTGRLIYKDIKAREAANATMKADLFDLWLDEYWKLNISDDLGFTATSTDADLDVSNEYEDIEENYEDSEDVEEDVE